MSIVYKPKSGLGASYLSSIAYTNKKLKHEIWSYCWRLDSSYKFLNHTNEYSD